jgi:hypothetical protein
MRRLLLSISALAISASPFLAVTPAAAEHGEPYSAEGRCGSDGEKALGIQTVNTPAGMFYVDDRNFLLGNGLWLYQETNKLPHLQREEGTKADTHLEPAHPNKDICTDYAGADPEAEGYKADRCIN